MVSGDQRGQLILIGSLLVATTVVGSIVLLNTINASPGIYTEQDTRSLRGVERTVDQVQSDLERAFLVNTSVDEVNESLPYARGSSFERLVEEYERQYRNLSTADSVINVTLLDGRSKEGVLARQNTTDNGLYVSYPTSLTVVEDARSIPRLYLFVNQTDSSDELRVTVQNVSESKTIEVVGDTVKRQDGTWECQLNRNTDIELSFTNGRGVVSTNETYCGGLEFDLSPGSDIEVRIENSSGSADGTYIVTGSGSGATASGSAIQQRWAVSGPNYIVNPVFRIEYWDPDVEYESTLALYNRTGR